MNLDAYMDDFGRDLARAARTRRRRARRPLALAVPLAAAATVAAVVVPGKGGTVDAIAAARAALATDGEIVHMKLLMEGSRGPGYEAEHWTATGAWRTVHSTSDGQRRQIAYSNDRLRLYDPDRDVVTILPHARPAMGPSAFGDDLASDLRKLLAEGDLRDEGLVTQDGRQVRRLVRDLVSNDKYETTFIYTIDPDTFEPISGELRIQRKGGRVVPGPRFTVLSYERLPLNEQTDDLLELEKTPNTKYVWRG